MNFGLMVERAMAPDKIPILIDLGSVEDKAARDRADALMAAGLSNKNFSIEGNRRLLVKVPPKKSALLNTFPIVAGSTYWQTTHHWRGLMAGERVAKIPRAADRRGK